MDTITVGCRLPHGYMLEVGLTAPATKDGRLVRRHQKRTDYAVFVLKGTNEKTAEARRRNIPIVAMSNIEPEINQVPSEIWERWKKEYHQTWKAFAANGSLFEVKDKGDIKAQMIDSLAHPDGFAPMDPSGDKRAPKKDKIETAKFDD